MASIINNVPSLTARRNLGQSEQGLNRTIERLSTGLRINNAYDDAAGLQISNNLRADIRILNQAERNANDALGRIDVADGVLQEAVNLLIRGAELAEQSASGTTTSAGRIAINQEWSEIQDALNAIDSDTRFDGQSIFGQAYSVRVGERDTEIIGVSAADVDATSLGVTGDMLTSTNASTTIAQITAAIETLSANRGSLGAKAQRLNTVINSLGISSENLQAAESQIRDADVASEVVSLTKYQILNQTGVSALTQANQSAQSVLSLLQ